MRLQRVLITTVLMASALGSSAAGQAASVFPPVQAARRAAYAASRRTEQVTATEPTSQPAGVASAQETATPASGSTATPSKSPVRRTVAVRGRRDPFQSIIRTEKTGMPSCVAGKKCLVPQQVVLRGIVTAPSGRIAVVENTARKTYFLHEGDPVFNGRVVRITANSVVFREFVSDRVGRKSMRDVAKQVVSTPWLPEGVSQSRPTSGGSGTSTRHSESEISANPGA